MRYYWLKDQSTHNNINIYWKKGKDESDPNLADYPTKHHSTIHHKGVSTYTLNSVSHALQGCVDPVEIHPRTQFNAVTSFQSPNHSLVQNIYKYTL